MICTFLCFDSCFATRRVFEVISSVEYFDVPSDNTSDPNEESRGELAHGQVKMCLKCVDRKWKLLQLACV